MLFGLFGSKKTPEIKEKIVTGAGFDGWQTVNISNSGQSVTSNSSMSVPAVLSAVTSLAQDVAKVRLSVYQMDRQKNEKRVAFEHPLHKILTRRPNFYQSIFEFVEYIMHSLNLDGNAYIFTVKDGRGKITELIPLQPARVTIYESENGEVFYAISPGTSFERALLRRLPEYDNRLLVHSSMVTHLRYHPSGSGLKGVSPIALARDSIGVAIAQQEHAGSIAKNGASLRGVLSHPKQLSKEVAERLKRSFEENYSGSANSGKTLVLEEGMTFSPVSMNMVDSQFVEQRKLSVLDIARIFRVPPTKLMDMSRSTYSNVEQENLSYVTDSLMPFFERIESCFNVSLFTEKEQDSGYFVEFDIERLYRGDILTRYKSHGLAIQWGLKSPNEVRKSEGLNPYEGGEKFIQPLNMIPVDDRESVDLQDKSKNQVSEIGENLDGEE